MAVFWLSSAPLGLCLWVPFVYILYTLMYSILVYLYNLSFYLSKKCGCVGACMRVCACMCMYACMHMCGVHVCVYVWHKGHKSDQDNQWS